MTMLYRSTHRRCRGGAPVKNLAHSASFHSKENNAPSKPGIKQLDAKLDKLVKMGGAQASPTPQTFSDSDSEEVVKLLVEGRVRLPKYAKVTVVTEVEEIKDKIFGTSTIFTHLCDQLCARQLQPMSIQPAIESGLLVKLGGNWLWNEATYRKLVPPDPRLIP
jgi:hypothetical protein